MPAFARARPDAIILAPQAAGEGAIDVESELWIGQFNIVHSQVQEQGPWVGAFHGFTAGAPTRFYVVAEPASPGGEQYCGQLVQALGSLFGQKDLSMTGNLLRALRSAHHRLREWNRTSIPEDQVGAGATCMALREELAFIAQVGPSLAYGAERGAVRRLRPRTDDACLPLGLSEEFRPSLSRLELGVGDAVFLATSSFADLVDDDHAATLLGMPPEDALAEVYLLAKELPNFGALLVAHVAAGAGSGGAGSTAAPPAEQSTGPLGAGGEGGEPRDPFAR